MRGRSIETGLGRAQIARRFAVCVMQVFSWCNAPPWDTQMAMRRYSENAAETNRIAARLSLSLSRRATRLSEGNENCTGRRS